jgi:hypothetical protein
MRVHISLTVGLTLAALGLGVVLSRSPAVVARSNDVPIERPIGIASKAFAGCQAEEALPSGTTAIRLALEAQLGPRVRVKVLRGRAVLTRGERAAGWSRQSVTVPVQALDRPVADVSVCFSMAPRNETVFFKGANVAGTTGPVLDGRIRIEYLRPGSRSWLALVPSLARRMSLGRATSGTWIVLAAAVAMLVVVAIASWLVVQGPR